MVRVWDSDLFGWSGLLLGGLNSALTTSTISLVVFFSVPIKHVDADSISSGSRLALNYIYWRVSREDCLDEIHNVGTPIQRTNVTKFLFIYYKSKTEIKLMLRSSYSAQRSDERGLFRQVTAAADY